MVDQDRLRAELNRMRELIDTDPRVLAYFDADGNGVIDGDEWAQVRALVIQRLQREEAEHQIAAQVQVPPQQPAPAEVELPVVGGQALEPVLGTGLEVDLPVVGGEDMGSGLELDIPAAGGDDTGSGLELDVPVVTGSVAQQIYEQDLPMVAGVTMVDDSRRSLADMDDFIVEEQGLSQIFGGLARRNYAILSPDGEQVGMVQQRENEALQNLTARIGNIPDLNFDVTDSTTGESFSFQRNARLMGDSVVIFDSGGSQLGHIASKFGIFNPRHHLVMTGEKGHVSVQWKITRPFTLSILDFMDEPAGEIQRGWSGFGAFIGGANRMRVRIDGDMLAPAFRYGLLAAAVLADMSSEGSSRSDSLTDLFR